MPARTDARETNCHAFVRTQSQPRRARLRCPPQRATAASTRSCRCDSPTRPTASYVVRSNDQPTATGKARRPRDGPSPQARPQSRSTYRPATRARDTSAAHDRLRIDCRVAGAFAEKAWQRFTQSTQISKMECSLFLVFCTWYFVVCTTDPRQSTKTKVLSSNLHVARK